MLERPRLFFEDIDVGSEIPPLTKPVSMTTLVKFAGASGDFAPIHHDIEFAKNRQGLPGAIIMSPLKFAYLVQVITNWAGVDGRLKKLHVWLKGMDLVGDTLVAGGRVTKKYRETTDNCVELEVWLENERTQLKTTVGKASVFLPTRC